MRKMLVAAVPLAALVLGCGADSKSCSTTAAHLTSVASGCTLAPNSDVSIRVSAACESCAHTSPSCTGEQVGNEIQLNPTFQECAEDLGCPNTGSCPFGAFTCTFHTPAAGTINLIFPTAGGSLQTVPVTIGGGGTTSCTQALRFDAP